MKFSIFVTLLITLPAALAESPIGGLKGAPGSISHGKIAVPAGSDGPTEIPITIINGAKPGPTLTFITSTNGTEYPAIWGMHEIIGQLKPAEMTGRLVLVPIANLPAFKAR